jgi:hypothetical protein
MGATGEELGIAQPVLEQVSGILELVRGDPVLSAALAGAGLAVMMLLAWLVRKSWLWRAKRAQEPAEAEERLEVGGGWVLPHFGAGSPEGEAAVAPEPLGLSGDLSGALSRIDQSVARARLDLERLSRDMRLLRSSQKTEQGKVATKISALKDELAALSASFAKREDEREGGTSLPFSSAAISAEIASIVRDLHLE